MIFLLPMTTQFSMSLSQGHYYNNDNNNNDNNDDDDDILYIMEITRIFNMTVNLTYSPPVTTDNGYYRTIFGTYLQVMRCIGEEKPVLVLKL